MSTVRLEDRALEILKLWREGGLTEESVEATDQFAAGIKTGLLDSAWATTSEMAGVLEQVGTPTASEHPPYTVVDVPMDFERLQAIARVSFDSDARLAGLFLAKPGEQPA